MSIENEVNQLKNIEYEQSIERHIDVAYDSAVETVSGHLPEKLRHFVSSNTFLCFRVRLKVEVRVSGNTFKNVFGQTSVRVSVLDLVETKLFEFVDDTVCCRNTL